MKSPESSEQLPSGEQRSFTDRLAARLPLLLAIIILLAFWPLLRGEFLAWDDKEAVARNLWLNPPSLQHFAEFWDPRRPFMDIWIPLTYSVWSGVAAISYVPTPDIDTGTHLNPWFFHGTNLAVHLLSALTVLAILRRLTGRPWPAFFGALIFALHPVQVESVGWISGLKDVLAGCLGLVAIWQYLVFTLGSGERDRSGMWVPYLAATAAFIAAMLAKPSAVAVPLVIIALDYLLIGRPIKKIMLAAAPWLVLALPIIWAGKHAQPAAEAFVPTLTQRPLIAADALAFYLYKLFLPLRLGIVYDHTPQAVLARSWVYFEWIVPAIALASGIALRRRAPWLVAAIAVFWLATAPVLGLIPFDFQQYSTVADHYLYLAMLGPALAAAYLARQMPSTRAPLAVVAVALATISFVQTWVWQDTFSLFRHSIAVNPNACGLYNNLGEAYRVAGQTDEAMRIFDEGLAHSPHCVVLHITRASLLANLGRIDDAERELRLAQPDATGRLAEFVKIGFSRLAEARRQARPSPTSRPSTLPS
ncbi:MAG TPA: tetratricopeptide repeat protein [Humisphaera sp.]|jgi:tetratricopeptide (TPR) repeat protein|nr:tetratricopeptide repeat protein [Humisphaera sp.]